MEKSTQDSLLALLNATSDEKYATWEEAFDAAINKPTNPPCEPTDPEATTCPYCCHTQKAFYFHSSPRGTGETTRDVMQDCGACDKSFSIHVQHSRLVKGSEKKGW